MHESHLNYVSGIIKWSELSSKILGYIFVKIASWTGVATMESIQYKILRHPNFEKESIKEYKIDIYKWVYYYIYNQVYTDKLFDTFELKRLLYKHTRTDLYNALIQYKKGKDDMSPNKIKIWMKYIFAILFLFMFNEIICQSKSAKIIRQKPKARKRISSQFKRR